MTDKCRGKVQALLFDLDGAPSESKRALGGTASPDQQQRALQFFLAHYEEHKLDFTREYPGVRETLKKLRGVPMAVLTNKPVNISVRILEGLGLAEFFRAIYGGNSFATKKPDPLGANTILEELVPLVRNGVLPRGSR